MGLQVHTEARDDLTTVTLAGELDIYTVADFRARLAAGEPLGLEELAPGARRELDGFLERYGCRARHRSITYRRGVEAPDEALLVTTADHALLTPDIVEHFTAAAERSVNSWPWSSICTRPGSA